MERKLKHFVDFWYAGLLVPEVVSKEIKKRPAPDMESNYPVPPGAFAFLFYDISVFTDKETGMEYESKRINESNVYMEGVILKLEDIERFYPGQRILISNMRINKMEKIVRTSGGNFYEVRDDWVVLYSLRRKDNVKNNM